MAAATAMRSARGEGARRPFAPVVVSPPPPPPPSRAENQMSPEEAVLGGGGKAAKKCPVHVSSMKTPAAAVVGRAASRRRVGSCAKRCSTPGAAAKAPYDAPVRDVSEAVGSKVRAMISSPACSEAGQERRRGSEGSASRKRAMPSVAVAVEEAMAGLPEPGEGRVKYLVDTFERLLFLAGGGGGPAARGRGGARRRKNEATVTAVASAPATPPGAEELLAGGGGTEARGRSRGARRKNEATVTAASAPSTPPGAEEIDVSYPSIASSSEVSFPGIAGVACILDASDRTSRIARARGQRRQRRYNSTGSPERGWSRKVTRVTSQHPFNLRTEQRGKVKEENFVQRLREKQMEEERLRNPLAQGLPYTTDEPETPVKPPMKEPTEPIDLVLHSDVRAVGRSKFDHQVAERNSFMEEVKLERERQQKVDEEIEIKQLRKEQVPRAHPMPDFTRPFVPKRSVKPKISTQIDEAHLQGIISFKK